MRRGMISMGLCCVVGAMMAGCSSSRSDMSDRQPMHGSMDKQPMDKQPMDMKEMEKVMMEMGTPRAEHRNLQSRVGTWDGHVKAWMMPGQPAEESTCTTTFTPMMDGRFLRSETRGNMLMGGHTMPFEGFGVYGFNNATGEYESTWCDNMGTMQMHFTGKASGDGRKIVTTSHFYCPMQKKNTSMREVETMTGPNTMMLEMYGPDMETGREYKMMQIDYTRR